jgi:hypothetical protein
MDIENLGGGVLVFKNMVEINHDFLIPYLAELHEKVVHEDFTVIHDDDGKELYAINRSGHRYPLSDIYRVNRIMGFAPDDENDEKYIFFNKCEDAVYSCLIRYIEQFPMILPSLWWRTQGHVVAYRSGSDMGFHSDNDVNYQPGAVPDMQVAIRHVLGAIIYLNDSAESIEECGQYQYVGGEIEFPYLGISHKPKSGDVIMFPSNFMATHRVKELFGGSRYAYISYFSHGSEEPSRGICPSDSDSFKLKSSQVWMPEIFRDYAEYLKTKYGKDLDNHHMLTLPLNRTNKSNGTIQEVIKEKNRDDL